jgi:hypothetical protein
MKMADLTLNDLIGAVQIIDLASTRGTFRGEELLPVGTLRERLAQYVKAEQEKAEAAADQNEEASE